jgi:hypothetical protein
MMASLLLDNIHDPPRGIQTITDKYRCSSGGNRKDQLLLIFGCKCHTMMTRYFEFSTTT